MPTINDINKHYVIYQMSLMQKGMMSLVVYMILISLR